IVAVEQRVELAGYEPAQRGTVGGELGAPRLDRPQDAPGVVAHQPARRAVGLGGGRGRRGLRGGQHRHGGERDGGERGHERLAGSVTWGHGVVPSSSAGDAAGAAASSAGALVPPPLNMYWPTIWIRSTAGWVNTISSPGCSSSGLPPGCSAT